MERVKHILVADPDIPFYGSFKNAPLGEMVNLTVVDSPEEGVKLVKDDKNKLDAILIDPSLDRHGVEIIRCALKLRPFVPIIMLESMHTEIDHQNIDSEKMGISHFLAKPFGPRDILNLLGKWHQHNKPSEDEEEEVADSVYIPIRLEFFVPGNKSLFDIYVKLKGGRHIKLFQTGSLFEIKRLNKYINAGVKYLYILKEDQNRYLNYCDLITHEVIQREEIGEKKKFAFLFNQAEVIMSSLHQLGINNNTILYAQRYVKDVFSFISQASENSDFLSTMLKEIEHFKHGVGVAVVVSIIARHLDMEAEQSIKILGSAAFLHDIGLIKDEDKENIYAFNDLKKRFVDEEDLLLKFKNNKIFGDQKNELKKLYQAHSAKGAELVKKIKSIPPVVSQIVRQHHALEQKRKGEYHGEIHFLAQLIELSDQFIHTVKGFEGKKVGTEYLLKSFFEQIADAPQKVRLTFEDAFKTIL